MEEIKKKDGRGGARKGAGRKPKVKVPITLNIDAELVELLLKNSNRSRLVNQLVRAFFKKKKRI